MHSYNKTFAAAALLAACAKAQNNSTNSTSSGSGSGACPSSVTGNYSAPSVASGYAVHLIATGLTAPRGIKFDTAGNLLVIEEEVGVTALALNDDGGSCVSVASKDTVVAVDTLNHGIELSADGTLLYASDSDKLYCWDYNADNRSVTSDATTLVENMEGSDHTSRTLELSDAAPGMIVINRGSFENIDVEARDIDSGHAQVKAFNISGISSPLDFLNDGILLGWGLRNDVGIAEHPSTGGIWSVENSGDQLNRSGEDIHQNNPAEKLNYLGTLLESSGNGSNNSNQGRNFGYPDCFAAWDAEDIPDFDGVTGAQFAPNDQNDTNNDQLCAERVAPRLVFDAHMAPLDIKFNSDGSRAYIAFHGSWNRDEPIGYKVSVVEFADGEPVEPSDSRTAATDIVSNPDESVCPDNCFRPVGLAWDDNGRLFMSSDSTGEIYMIVRDEASNGTLNNSTSTGGSGSAGGSGSGSGDSTSSSSPVEATTNTAVAHGFDGMGALAVLLCALAFIV